MDCFGCEQAATDPHIKSVGPQCISCQARALALVYGGMEREQIDPVLHMAWTDTKTFREGRRLFWNWCKLIEVAKEKS